MLIKFEGALDRTFTSITNKCVGNLVMGKIDYFNNRWL